MTLTGLIADLAPSAAARWGNKAAFHFEDRSLDFAEVAALAACFAGGLSARGVGAGDRVVLHLPNSWQWIIAYHGIAHLGAVVIPANILLSAAEVDFMIADSQARMVVVGADKRPNLKSVVEMAVVGHPTGSGDVAFAALLEASPCERPAIRTDALFTIGYTSGTTGRPKGAMLTHGNIFSSVAHTATIHVRHGGDKVYSALPFPHVYGNVIMNAVLLTGASLHAPARFNADASLQAIERERITIFDGVPTMYYQMLASPLIEKADLSSLVRCTVGGQTMPVAKIDQVVERFGCPLLELWGMTEVGGPATTHSPYWPPRPGSIGLPLPGTEIRIADLEDPARDAGASAGELMIRGDLVTSGYWNSREATAAAFADGWFATGDVARRDSDGYLYIVDRKKEMILTAGYNIYPAEIEQVIAMLPAVSMVAVAGYPDEEKGEIARAFVTRVPGQPLAEAELMAHCRAHLAAYKVPRAVFFVDDLPKTGTGKIMRRALNDYIAALSTQSATEVRHGN